MGLVVGSSVGSVGSFGVLDSDGGGDDDDEDEDEEDDEDEDEDEDEFCGLPLSPALVPELGD